MCRDEAGPPGRGSRPRARPCAERGARAQHDGDTPRSRSVTARSAYRLSLESGAAREGRRPRAPGGLCAAARARSGDRRGRMRGSPRADRDGAARRPRLRRSSCSTTAPVAAEGPLRALRGVLRRRRWSTTTRTSPTTARRRRGTFVFDAGHQELDAGETGRVVGDPVRATGRRAHPLRARPRAVPRRCCCSARPASAGRQARDRFTAAHSVTLALGRARLGQRARRRSSSR